MELLLTILTTLTLLQCRVSGEHSRLNNSAQSETRNNYEIPDISGHWKLLQTEVVDKVPFIEKGLSEDGDIQVKEMGEAGPFEFITVTDLFFSEDSVFKIDYPMELIETGTYYTDNNYLYISGSFGKETMPVSVNKDTLHLYIEGYNGSYLKETYLKTRFNDSIISILKRDTLNYSLLEGKWILKRDYWYDYGTHYWLEFPHEIPDTIVITRNQIMATLYSDRSYQMMTDGGKRKYLFGYKNPHLYLTPGAWYKGEDPYIHFERSENETE